MVTQKKQYCQELLALIWVICENQFCRTVLPCISIFLSAVFFPKFTILPLLSSSTVFCTAITHCTLVCCLITTTFPFDSSIEVEIFVCTTYFT